jgi:hypothetical protein
VQRTVRAFAATTSCLAPRQRRRTPRHRVGRPRLRRELIRRGCFGRGQVLHVVGSTSNFIVTQAVTGGTVVFDRPSRADRPLVTCTTKSPRLRQGVSPSPASSPEEVGLARRAPSPLPAPIVCSVPDAPGSGPNPPRPLGSLRRRPLRYVSNAWLRSQSSSRCGSSVPSLPALLSCRRPPRRKRSASYRRPTARTVGAGPRRTPSR